MIYTNIDEANQRIAELESQVLSYKNKISGTRIIANDMIIFHKTFLNIQIPMAKFKADDTSFMTVLEYCEAFNQTLIYSNDKEFVALPFEMMDITNDYGALKEVISNTTLEINGYKLADLFGGIQPKMGGLDYTQNENHLVWVLSYSAFQEFKKVNPHFNCEVIEDETVSNA